MENFDLKKYLAEGRLLKEKMSLEVDDDFIELSADSGEYDGDLNDDGTVDFSVVYDDGTEFDDSTWKSILGPKHAFVQISNKIPTKVEAAGDYVMITVNLEDLKKYLSEGKLLKEDVSEYEVGDKVKFNPSTMKDKGFEDLQQYYGGLIGVIEKVSQDELEIKLNKSITPPGGGNIDGILLMKSEGDYEMITNQN